MIPRKNVLHIDIETYSSVDIAKSGLYKYVQSPDFQILLFAYAYDDGPVEIIDLAQGEKLPEKVINDLKAPATIKMAHNANFEINALSQFYEIWPDQWQLYDDPFSLLRVSGIPCRSWESNGIPSGEAKDGGWKSTDPLFLCTMQAYKEKRRTHKKLS